LKIELNFRTITGYGSASSTLQVMVLQATQQQQNRWFPGFVASTNRSILYTIYNSLSS